MVLLKCPECGGNYSSKALVCPHCGMIIPPTKEQKLQANKMVEKSVLSSVGWIIFIGILSIFDFILFMIATTSTDAGVSLFIFLILIVTFFILFIAFKHVMRKEREKIEEER